MQSEWITSRQNPLIQHIKKLLNSKSYRMECGEYAADGVKLLSEALRWNAPITVLVETKDAVTDEIPMQVRRVTVPEELMQFLSPMKAPQGVLFVCRLPEKKELTVPPKALLLDGLQDPGNVGTILRTADALSVPVLLTEDCADPFNPKTIRATMGAAFRMDIRQAEREEILSCCARNGIPIMATALSSRAVDIRSCELRGLIAIGSEGSGVSRSVLEAAETELIIPMNANCESLNAASAATIVMWEMSQRR